MHMYMHMASEQDQNTANSITASYAAADISYLQNRQERGQHMQVQRVEGQP